MDDFKTFCLEEQKTRKVFIDHLDKMKPLQFIELAKKFNKEFAGIIPKDGVSFTEKVDGSALRIGQDENGKSFIESSMSPSTFNVGDFKAAAIAKGYTGEIGEHFDNILRLVKNDKAIQKVLSRYNTNGIKVIGEILYPPLGTDELDKMKFIRISYDKKKLGTDYTFVPFEVIDGEGNMHSAKQNVLTDLYRLSNSKRKIIKPSIKVSSDIDISIELKDFENNITKKYGADLERLLTSRKKIDRELKNRIKEEMLEYQRIIADKILTYINGGLLGPDYEGVVIKLSDGTIFKIVTQAFKSGKFKHL